MNTQEQFIDWVCGKTNDFPFFKNLRNVKLPDTQYEDYYGSEQLDDDLKRIREIETYESE